MAGLPLLAPADFADITGLALFGLVVASQLVLRRRSGAAAAT